LQLPPLYEFRDFTFVSTERGWIAVLYETPTESFGIIYFTEDGGITWTEQLELNSTQLGHGGVIVNSVAFLNDSLGWAVVGGFMDNFDNMDIYFTDDGGENWNKIGESKKYITNVIPITEDSLWSFGRSVERTMDGGKSWNYIEPQGYPFGTMRILPRSGLTVWAINHYYGGDSDLLFTGDGGITWALKYSFGNSTGFALTNYEDKYLWIIGENGLIIMGKDILTSMDKNLP